MSSVVIALVIVAFLGLLVVDVWWHRHCQRAVDKWNAERPPGDPSKASIY